MITRKKWGSNPVFDNEEKKNVSYLFRVTTGYYRVHLS